jgi:formate dehydrogenase major subunit
VTARPTRNRLCVKGRFGFDYARHPQRLTKPLIRRADAPKHKDFVVDPANPLTAFREATWEEALALASGKVCAKSATARGQRAGRLRLGQGHERRGLPVPEAGAHRLRHATTSTTAPACATPRRWPRCSKAWFGAVSPTRCATCSIRRLDLADRRQPGAEPPGGRDLDQERSAQRRQAHAWPTRAAPSCAPRNHLGFKPDTDVALLNAMMHTIIVRGPGRRSLHQ